MALIGGAAAMGFSRAAGSQQSATLVIGFLSSRAPSESSDDLAAFRRGLADAGVIENRDVAIDYRWSPQPDGLRSLAVAFVERPVGLIFASDSQAIRAAMAATAVIPITFVTGSDPVDAGYVTSLNRPGGNVTGVTFLTKQIGAKRLSILHELVPHASSIAMLANPANANAEAEIRDVQDAARTLRLDLRILKAKAEDDFGSISSELVQQHVDGLLIGTDPFFDGQRDRLVQLAASRALPTI
jgi:putative ABC transport system substrate-binding protein